MTASMPEKSVPTLRGRGNIAGGSIVAVIAAWGEPWVVGLSLGMSLGMSLGVNPSVGLGVGLALSLGVSYYY